jgi:hypothetical protein
MNKKETNRANQISISKEFTKGVQLIDIDTTIAEYMVDSIIPNVEENGNQVKVPLLYGNAERWNNARTKGYLRDSRGKIQLPLVMFKRNSIDRQDGMAQFKDVNTLPAYKKYSQKNKYERFSLQTNVKRATEQYEISVPDYVTVTYEVMIWTSFTEHMNSIVEQFQYATDRYWGTEKGFKFRTRIDSFDNQQEVGEGSERVIRTSFTMVTNAYLLPETSDDKPTVKKSFNPKKVIWGVETDLSGTQFTNPNIYNEYQSVIDFVAIRSSQSTEFVSGGDSVTGDGAVVKLTNVRLPILPNELIGTFDTKNWFRIYINSEFKPASLYTYSFNGANEEIIFTFNETLGFPLDNADEIDIVGKYEQL